MKRHSATTILCIFLAFSLTLPRITWAEDRTSGGVPASAGDLQPALAELLQSGDIRISEEARSGAPIELLTNSADIEAGEPITITVGAIIAALTLANTVLSAADLALCFANADMEVENILMEMSKYDDPAKAMDRFREINQERGYLTEPELNDIVNEAAKEAAVKTGQEFGKFVAVQIGKKLIPKAVYRVALKFGKKTAQKAAKNVAKALGVFTLPLTVYEFAKSASGSLELAKEQYTLATTWKGYWYMFQAAHGVAVSGESLVLGSETYLGEVTSTFAALSELIKGGEFFSSSDLDHWSYAGAMAGLSAFGPVSALDSSSDGRFGLVHTGLGDTSGTGYMTQVIKPLKSSQAVFNARYNFVTTEFPEWLGDVYNDSYRISIVDVSTGVEKTLASFSGALNQIFTDSDTVYYGFPSNILDMADTGAGVTGWETKSTDLIPLGALREYEVRIRVNDVTDQIWDSALLVDKVSLR